MTYKDSNPKSPYHSLYISYRDMIRRCYNPNFRGYQYWGGRGISVCDEWLNNYNAFRQWAISCGWEKGLTIDRIDSNGNYTPTNCRWLDRKKQSLNLRNTNLYECNGLVFSQRKIIEFLWTLNIGEEVCVKKIKCNEMRVGNPYHKNHKNHYSQ